MQITKDQVQETIHVLTESLMCINENQCESSEKTRKLIKEQISFFSELKKSEETENEK